MKIKVWYVYLTKQNFSILYKSEMTHLIGIIEIKKEKTSKSQKQRKMYPYKNFFKNYVTTLNSVKRISDSVTRYIKG